MTPADLLLYPAIGWLFHTPVPALQAVPGLGTVGHRVRPGRLPQRVLSGGRLQVQPRGQKKLEYPEWTVLSRGQSRPLVTKPFFDR